MSYVGLKVKHDEITKGVVFLTALSADSDDPINLFLRGPSGIGKTYCAVEILKLWPREKVWWLGGLSPKALIHDYGILEDAEGNEINLDEKPAKEASKEEKDKWRERLAKARYVVNLSGKILLFLEAPHIETFNLLRPILSHDVRETSYKFVDKLEKGRLKTFHVVIRRWPATIFCSTDEKYVQDLATRGLTVTPEMELGKYKAAIELAGLRKSQPWKVEDPREFEALRYFLRVLTDRLSLSHRVLIPYSENLAQIYPSVIARDMRDFPRLLSLIEKSCLLHVFQRPAIKKDEVIYFLATMQDFALVFPLLQGFEETTRAGIPGHLVNFFNKVIMPVSVAKDQFHYKDLVEQQSQTGENPLSSKTIREYTRILEDIGWVDTEPDPDNRRMVLIQVIKKPANTPFYAISKSLPFFSLEDFKNWLDSCKNYSTSNSVLLYKNYCGDEESKIDLGQNDEGANAYIERLFEVEYFLDKTKLKLEPIREEKPKDTLLEQNGIFPPPILTQENLEAVTSCFEKHGKRDGRGLVLSVSFLTDKLKEKGVQDPRQLISRLTSEEWNAKHDWHLEFTNSLNEIRLVKL